MTKVNRWLLPEGIEELLPEQAVLAESLRRDLLDTYRSWGYQLVRPPLVEFLESLQVGTGQDLALQTFTLTDQLSGRLMGLRADLTPQVARMDAHSLKREAPARLCYCAPVLHSKSMYMGASRELDQIGIELFGGASVNADAEVIDLMLQTVSKAGAFSGTASIKLDLGNVAIFRAAAKYAGLDAQAEGALLDILQRKALPELDSFLEEQVSNASAASLLRHLPNLSGDEQALQKAKALFSDIDDQSLSRTLLSALEDLYFIHDFVKAKYSDIDCYFDLGELRGYDYHTGLVFAVYREGFFQPLAKGGRYDAIGSSFGRSRPATGFSSDLRQLLKLLPPGKGQEQLRRAIFAPTLSSAGEDGESLLLLITGLRDQGETVIQALSNEEEQLLKKAYCDRELLWQNGKWDISTL